MKHELRHLPAGAERRILPFEVRAETRGDGQLPVLRGHAAVFNVMSEDLGGFREIIAPGFFDDVLADDVRALFNHNPDLIVGRSKAKTLSLRVDETGLETEIEPPDNSTGRDLVVSVQRGDVDQMSFAFSIEYGVGDKWDVLEGGDLVRTLIKAKRLYDVSPVTYPAYLDTDVAVRSLNAAREAGRLPSPIAERAIREAHRRRLLDLAAAE